MVYVSVPLILLNFLVFPDNTAESGYYPGLLAGVFILIMINDTAAYLVGVPFGRHRLFKRVSPKKSWEGFAGGAVFVVTASLVMNRIFPVPDVTGWFLIGLIVSVFGVYGDLVESLFKRSLDIKDSGSILPGHGGVLDRIDAWLFVIPLVWILINFIY
jgi:phosphatidate cytidylyltransferase